MTNIYELFPVSFIFLENIFQILGHIGEYFLPSQILLTNTFAILIGLAELTQNPAELTQNPAELSQNPAELNQNPTELTKNPTELTKNPAELTKNPAELTLVQNSCRIVLHFS